MKERPIIFNAEMVRAILEGKKTETRRIVKNVPGYVDFLDRRGGDDGNWRGYMRPGEPTDFIIKCPYGKVGDRLWVRETWKPGAWRRDGRVAIDYKASPELTNTPWCYPPDDEFNSYWIEWTEELIDSGLERDDKGMYRWEPGKSPLRWRPSIFMPRWTSRISLEITDVRVKQVQSIHRRDCQKEGILCSHCKGYTYRQGCTCQQDFARLWDTINEKRGYSWDSNPWVWVIEFRKIL